MSSPVFIVYSSPKSRMAKYSSPTNEADLSLPTLTSHLPAKRAELGEVVLVLDIGGRRVAMDDPRLVPDQGATSLVVAPDTLGLRIGGRTAEHPPEHLQGGIHPARLIDSRRTVPF